MPKYLVEVYAPARVELVEVEARARRAATESANGRVRYLRSIRVPEDEMWFHLFEAPSAEPVRKAVEVAGLPYARIVEAVE